MSNSASFGGLIQRGRLLKPNVGSFVQTLTLSKRALEMGCIGCVLPGDGIPPFVIGPNGSGFRLSKTTVGTGGTLESIVSSEEGLALNGQNQSVSANYNYFTGQILSGNPGGTSATIYSIVARLKAGTGTLSAGYAAGLAVGTTGNGGVHLGLDSAKHALAAWRSSGGSNVTATGSVVYTGYVTLGATGVSTKAVQLYENGFATVLSANNAGSDSTPATTNAFLGGFTGGAFQGNVAWVFYFERRLSAEEQWLVFAEPWLLLEFASSNFIGRKTGSQALTLTAAFGSYIFTGEAATLTKALHLSAGFGLYNYTGEAAALNIGRLMNAGRGLYNYTGENATLFVGHTLNAGFGSYAYTGEAATLNKALKLSAAFGPYTFTGQNATLTPSNISAAPLPPSVRWVGPNAGKTDEQ